MRTSVKRQSNSTESTKSTKSTNLRMQMIPIDQIVPNPEQPRKNIDNGRLDGRINEIAESIKLHGIINPITVRSIGNNKYQIVAGELRYRAAKIVGLAKMPCTDSGDRDHAAIAIIENCLRADLSPMEKAQAFRDVIDTGVQQNELAEKLGLSPSTVSDVLSLLGLPQDIQKECLDNPKYALREMKKIAQSKDSDDVKRERFDAYKADRMKNRKTTAGKNARRDQDILDATVKLSNVLNHLPNIDPDRRKEIVLRLKDLNGELQKVFRKYKS